MGTEAGSHQPIILCQPASSGGSLIFKAMVAQFNLLGISEISHCFPFLPGAFVPTDPEWALLVRGVIDWDTYGEMFVNRILNTVDICKRKNLTPLIREHTHSYFFTGAQHVPLPSRPSWIAEQIYRRAGLELKCVVTVRDPVDSWLGLAENHYEQIPKEFESYCSYFESFVRSILRNLESGSILLIRYEDFVENPLAQLNRAADFLGFEQSKKMEQGWRNVVSTGNSGRQSKCIEKRSRRPFDFNLLRSARTSQSYSFVVESLGYPHICTSATFGQRARALTFHAERTLATFIRRTRDNVRVWLHKRARTTN